MFSVNREPKVPPDFWLTIKRTFCFFKQDYFDKNKNLILVEEINNDNEITSLLFSSPECALRAFSLQSYA